jgi:hypothetical protein
VQEHAQAVARLGKVSSTRSLEAGKGIPLEEVSAAISCQMGNQILLAPEAEQDLDEIVAYIAKENPAAAEKFGIHLTAARFSGESLRSGHFAGRERTL